MPDHLYLTFGETNDRCDECRTPTRTVTANEWTLHGAEESEDLVEPRGEISGHFCPECRRLTAIFLHRL